MYKKILKTAFILLTLAVVTAGCNQKAESEIIEDFCLNVNVENIDKTIPAVNQFLRGLSAELNVWQQLSELAAWLESQPCIVDAEIRSMSEIVISFATQRLIMELSMERPLKVAGYREYKPLEAICEPGSLLRTMWKLVGIVDVQTGDLKVLERADCEHCFTLSFDNTSPCKAFPGEHYSASVVTFNNYGTIRFTIDYDNCSVQIFYFSSTSRNEWCNCGRLFTYAFLYMRHADTTPFYLQGNELRLYYNDNNNYLLFGSTLSCWESIIFKQIIP